MTIERILVTGASGFTGRHFISAANAEGHHCIALCRSNSEIVADAGEHIYCDLIDRSGLVDAVRTARPTKVIHLAAISFVAHGNNSEIYAINQLGTINLLDALNLYESKVDHIILASSANIYGNASALPITEETAPNPANHYGCSKYAMEIASRLYKNVPVTIVRPFNYTGRGQSTNFLIPKLVSAFRSGETSIELGNLHIARDFSDVRDVVRAYLKLLVQVPKKVDVLNICSGTPTSLTAIVDHLASMAGYRMKIEVNSGLVRQDEIEVLYGSPALLETVIGQYREYNLSDTLRWMMSE